MTLVKSLHSGDPDKICPVCSEYVDLGPGVLGAGRCFADALQILFGIHPSAIHEDDLGQVSSVIIQYYQ
jgi:hypothetical protein